MIYLKLFVNAVAIISVQYYMYKKHCLRIFSNTSFYKVFITKTIRKQNVIIIVKN